MKLIKTSLQNGIAVGIRILTLLGINKLLAIYVGSAGYAVIGQFQNAITMITGFASGATNTGVTKYTAEYYNDASIQHRVWSTAAYIALIGSLLSAVVIICFSKSLSLWLLKDEAYWSIFFLFALFLIFFVFNALLLAILNGKKEIESYVLANISGSIIGLCITAFLVIYFGLYGLVALAAQSINFFVTFFICYRADWFKLSYFFASFDKKIAKDLAKFTLMALTTAICFPLSQVYIRQHLGEHFSWEIAGYWEAMCRLSSAYLLLVTTTLSVYYLPRLSEFNEGAELKKEIFQGYKIILPIVIIIALFIFALKDLIINLLFTEEFQPMRQLFLGQLIGDVLKIGSWILAFFMLSKAMTKAYIITEILFSISFYFVVILLTNRMGFEGVSWAYAINYFIYWIVMYFIIFRNSRLGLRPITTKWNAENRQIVKLNGGHTS